MWKCPKCKEECEDTFDSCWNCGTGRDGSPPAVPISERSDTAFQDSSQANRPKGSRHSLMSRYTDAYLAARTITAFGAIVKIIAFIIGGGIILVGLIVAIGLFRMSSVAFY